MESPNQEFVTKYSDQMAVQMRKGLLGYFILLITKEPVYASDIIHRLDAANVRVVEGTIYPLLSRLQRDGLLEHEWKESPSGPPRKYYHLTATGQAVIEQLHDEVTSLNQATNILKGEK